MTYTEKEVKELLKLQRELCSKNYEVRFTYPSSAAIFAIKNAPEPELKNNDDFDASKF